MKEEEEEEVLLRVCVKSSTKSEERAAPSQNFKISLKAWYLGSYVNPKPFVFLFSFLFHYFLHWIKERREGFQGRQTLYTFVLL